MEMIFLILGVIVIVGVSYVIGEIGVYRRGGDVFDWTVKIDKYFPKWVR